MARGGSSWTARGKFEQRRRITGLRQLGHDPTRWLVKSAVLSALYQPSSAGGPHDGNECSRHGGSEDLAASSQGHVIRIQRMRIVAPFQWSQFMRKLWGSEGELPMQAVYYVWGMGLS